MSFGLKYVSRTILFALGGLLIGPCSAWAAAEAIRSPSLPGSALSTEFASQPTGILALNPSGASVPLVPNLSSVTQIEVDATFGVVRGRAGYSVTEAIPINKDLIVISNSVGSVLALGRLSGPEDGPVFVTASFYFDGSFSAQGGLPYMSLGGTLSVENITTNTFYISQLYFYTTNGSSAIETSTVAATRPISDPNEDFPYLAATPQIFSSDPNALSGVAVVSFEANVGDEIAFRSELQGLTAPFFRNTELLPSSASVNFLNSGRFSLAVPEGYSFSSQDQIFENVVTSVPEVSTNLLLLAGLFALFWRGESISRKRSCQ